MPERRRRTRVAFHTAVELEATGASFKGLETRDLSHKGLFLLSQLPLAQGDKCTVSVHLAGQEEGAPEMRMQGRVARVTAEGTAIDFLSMDPDTYLHLRNLILLNAEDTDTVEQEFGTAAFDKPPE